MCPSISQQERQMDLIEVLTFFFMLSTMELGRVSLCSVLLPSFLTELFLGISHGKPQSNTKGNAWWPSRLRSHLATKSEFYFNTHFHFWHYLNKGLIPTIQSHSACHHPHLVLSISSDRCRRNEFAAGLHRSRNQLSSVCIHRYALHQTQTFSFLIYSR